MYTYDPSACKTAPFRSPEGPLSSIAQASGGATATELQSCRATELQSYRATELQSYRATELKSYRATELQSYSATAAEWV